MPDGGRRGDPVIGSRARQRGVCSVCSVCSDCPPMLLQFPESLCRALYSTWTEVVWMGHVLLGLSDETACPQLRFTSLISSFLPTTQAKIVTTDYA